MKLKRRALLASAMAAGVAGCMSAPEPNAPITDDLVSRLVDRGIQATSSERNPQGIDVMYRSRYDNEEGATIELVIVAVTFAKLVSDRDFQGLLAPIVTSGGGSYLRYTINSRWAKEYNNGELTLLEYTDRALGYMVRSSKRT